MGPARAADVLRVGDGPFISGGGYYIAREKGYFKKLGIEIQHREFIDGALSVPAFVSGELDIAGMTAAAGLFNSVAKGAPLVIILDRGHNRPGSATRSPTFSQELYDQGVHSLGRFRQAQGQARRRRRARQHQPIQCRASRSPKPASIPPRTCSGPSTSAQPDLMKMLGQKQLDVTDLAYQFGFSRRTTNGARSSPTAIRSRPAWRSPISRCARIIWKRTATW